MLAAPHPAEALARKPRTALGEEGTRATRFSARWAAYCARSVRYAFDVWADPRRSLARCEANFRISGASAARSSGIGRMVPERKGPGEFPAGVPLLFARRR